jgi:hypothetical protein
MDEMNTLCEEEREKRHLRLLDPFVIHGIGL